MNRDTHTYQVTDDDRHMVSHWKALGATNEQIARSLQISKETLAKHFKHELKTELSDISNGIATNLANIARGEGSAAVSAAKYWLGSQAGWREKAPEVPEAERVQQYVVFTEIDPRQDLPPEVDPDDGE